MTLANSAITCIPLDDTLEGPPVDTAESTRHVQDGAARQAPIFSGSPHRPGKRPRPRPEPAEARRLRSCPGEGSGVETRDSDRPRAVLNTLFGLQPVRNRYS